MTGEIMPEWEALPVDRKIAGLERSMDYYIGELLYGKRLVRQAEEAMESLQARIRQLRKDL